MPAASSTSRGADAHAIEDDRELVHQRDVEIALRVLDDLRGLGDLDRRRAVDAGVDDRAVRVGDALERRRVLARDDLHDALERVLLVARVDALGRVAELEVLALREARDLGEDRPADVLGDARVDRRLVDDDGALLEAPCRRSPTPSRPASRSGTLLLSTGVGTATTKNVTPLRSAMSLVIVQRRRLRARSSETSLVPIEAAAELLDLLLVDVEPDGARELARERQRHGQTDVSETNDCDPLLHISSPPRPLQYRVLSLGATVLSARTSRAGGCTRPDSRRSAR